MQCRLMVRPQYGREHCQILSWEIWTCYRHEPSTLQRLPCTTACNLATLAVIWLQPPLTNIHLSYWHTQTGLNAHHTINWMTSNVQSFTVSHNIQVSERFHLFYHFPVKTGTEQYDYTISRCDFISLFYWTHLRETKTF